MGADFGSLPKDAEKELLPIVVEATSHDIGRAIARYSLSDDIMTHRIIRSVSRASVLGQLYAKIALVPELGGAILELLSASGSGIFSISAEGQMPFDEELLRLKYAIPLYDRPGRNGPSRVYISSEGRPDEVAGQFATIVEDEAVQIPNVQYDVRHGSGRHKIVIIGTNSATPFLLNSLAAHNRLHPEDCVYVQLVVVKDQALSAQQLAREENFGTLFCKNSVCFVDSYLDINNYLALLDEDLRSLLILPQEGVEQDSRDRDVFEIWIALYNCVAQKEDMKKNLDNRVFLAVSSDENASLFEDAFHRKILAVNNFIGLLMNKMAEEETAQEVLVELLGGQDEAAQAKQRQRCCLAAVPANRFFSVDRTWHFTSKRAFILSVYRGTGGRVIPIGVAKGGSTFLFSNEKKVETRIFGLSSTPCLSDPYLLEREDGIYMGACTSIGQISGVEIEPRDTIIFLQKDYY